MKDSTRVNFINILRAFFSYESVIMHSTYGVNFTNVLRAAFTSADPKSAIKLLNLTVFFALLGSARVKAARRTLVKLTHGVCFVFFLAKGNWEKAARKMFSG